LGFVQGKPADRNQYRREEKQDQNEPEYGIPLHEQVVMLTSFPFPSERESRTRPSPEVLESEGENRKGQKAKASKSDGLIESIALECRTKEHPGYVQDRRCAEHADEEKKRN